MPMDGVARAAGADRGAALQDPARDRGPEPALADGRRDHERRRLRARLVRRGRGPGVYHSVSPAWGDANLRELAAHIESPLFLAHVRAAIGSPVQQTNCHPFRHGSWLFVHNGFIAGFHALRRDLMLAIDPELFADIHGSTDTEVVFYLALTFGLEEDPIGALERTVGFIEATAARHGVADAVQGSFGVSDGEQSVGRALRDRGHAAHRCSRRRTRTSIRRLHPDNPRLQRLSPEDRLIVSEPFSDLPGVWHEIEPSSAVTVHRGGVLEHRPFRPHADGPPRVARQSAGTGDA